MAPLRFAAVTFDCAQTLLEVRWDPATFAVECASALGYDLPRDESTSAYRRLLHARHQDFLEMNRLRSEEASDDFWFALTRDWANAVGLPAYAPAELSRLALERLYGPDSEVFRRFEDVLPALDALAQLGVKAAVVSNWDVSLHRTLRAHGLEGRFDVVVASLEEGVEKPDPEIFHIALRRLGVEPSSAIHVGDDPVDDLLGARGAGMRGLLVDRTDPEPGGSRINDLRVLAEVLASPS